MSNTELKAGLKADLRAELKAEVDRMQRDLLEKIERSLKKEQDNWRAIEAAKRAQEEANAAAAKSRLKYSIDEEILKIQKLKTGSAAQEYADLHRKLTDNEIQYIKNKWRAWSMISFGSGFALAGWLSYLLHP